MAANCRNSVNGAHQAGPPDDQGYYLCIHCGQPLLIVEDDRVVGNGCLLLILVATIAALLTAVAMTGL
jgi:hypothetical protein